MVPRLMSSGIAGKFNLAKIARSVQHLGDNGDRILVPDYDIVQGKITLHALNSQPSAPLFPLVLLSKYCRSRTGDHDRPIVSPLTRRI